MDGPRPGRSNSRETAVIELEPGRVNEHLQRFRQRMDRMVVGQPEAAAKVGDSLSRLIAGIHDPERPLLTMMFMGPTGVGKTETVRCLAESIFGDRRAYTRINCQEFSAHYNISKLLGSPPGYVGGEIRPLLAQENLDKHHEKALERRSGLICEEGSRLAEMYPSDKPRRLAIVLFDEIEKAHPKLWNTLLGILEDGNLVLANNEEVDFTGSIIVLTTNVGSRVLNTTLAQRGIGFHLGTDADQLDRDVEGAVLREAKKTFPMEFLNRFDEMITYRPLRREHLFAILDNQIAQVHQRALAGSEPFLLEVSPSAKERLVAEGTDPEYGARPLKRVVEKRLVTPISHLICSGQVRRGDLVVVDHAGGDFVFRKEPGIDWEGGDPLAGLLESSWARADLGVRDDGGEKKKMVEEAGLVTVGAGALGGGEV